MSIGNLTEQFLYERLPEAVINGDEQGYIEAVISGYQDRLEDVRSYAKNLNEFWVPGGLPTPANNVVLVDLTSQFGQAYTRSLDIQTDTPPDGSDRLSTWAAKQLGLQRMDAVSNVRYGSDPLRAVDVDTLTWLAATLGTLLYQTDLLPTDAATRAAQLQLVQTWFPRLKIKGTVQSFEVLGRILGFEDVRVTPLWTRLSPRVPEDVGNPLNDPDFAASPEYFPRQEIGPFYDPFNYRDGPFFSWTGTASNGTNSTKFYSQTITGHNPWVDVVMLGSLAGTNIPSVNHGTVTHPATGSYALHGGAPFEAAYVDCLGSSVRFKAVADGADFNGLYVHVQTAGTLAVVTVEDRLSAIKYRSSYFDLGLTSDMNTLEDIFGSRGATTNKDLEANPTLTSDGTAVSPYRPWINGSIVVARTTADWVTSDGSNVSTWRPRREADPGAGDRQLNMDSIVAAGVQVTQAFEEVRAATRLPRRSQAGFLIDQNVCYAPYPNQSAPILTTGAGTSYVGSYSLSPLPTYVADIHVLLPPVFYCSWIGLVGNTYIVHASYNFAPYVAVGTYAPVSTGPITFYDPFNAFVTLYSVLTVGGPPVLITGTGIISGGTIPVSSEINPLNQNEYLYGITNQPISYLFGGSWNWSTGTYHFVTDAFSNVAIHAVWTLTSTEVIRPEPSLVVKSTGVEGQESTWAFSCQGRPEDQDAGFVYEVADDYLWRREVVVGGELVELDSYYAGTELAIQEVEEATAFVDQTATDIDVYVIPSDNSSHPRVVWDHRSYVPGVYKPGYTAIAYSGTLKNLSSLTALETGTIKPPIGPSKGDTETDYDTLFQPGYGIYHVGLAQGVLVADLPKFFGPHHADGLQAWLAFNEHIDDNLTVVDHGFRSIASEMFGLTYASRSFDSERGWHLNLKNAQVAANEYLDIDDEITASFWIKVNTSPSVESHVVDLSPLYFTLQPGGNISAYSKTATGNLLIGNAFVGDGQWHFVYLRRSGTNAVFGSATLTAGAAENNVPGVYAAGDPDNDGPFYVQAFNEADYDFHDLRVWNVYKTEAQMDLVRYHAPNVTICTYRLGFVYTLEREDKFGIKVLPSGWAYPDVLPAWYRRTRQGLVLRYDSMGSYHGETRFKEVGMGDQRQPPDVYRLGQQFITMTGEGTAPFSTGSGAMPGWNPMWQATNSNGNYDVLPFSGSATGGIVPVSTASGSLTPWPNNMDQTNPFRQYVYVSTANGSSVYQVSLANYAGTVFLMAEPVAHGRTTAEINVDPYLSDLLADGTIYVAQGTGFVQGTYNGTTHSGTYGFYDPLTSTYYPKYFNGTDLYTSEIPTDAYVLLSGSNVGILVADPVTSRGSVIASTGTNSTPLLYMYTPSRVVASPSRVQAFQSWTDSGATPAQQHMDVTQMPSLVTLGRLNTPCLGDAGVIEFNNAGTLLPGVYELTIVSGQVGQADVDFSGFKVEVNINDTIFDTRLLHGYSGYNFSGTDTFQFDLNDSAYGAWLLTLTWTNPLEDTSKGTKRQLAVYNYVLRYLNMELFRVRPTVPAQITALTTTDFSYGTTPGGWFDTINSYGTSVGYAHESDIYTGNDTVTAVYPLGDTLTGLTSDRRNDIIYVGADVVVPAAGSFVFPSFGSTGTVSVYNPPQWFWAGALTANPSATISAKMTYETPQVRAAFSTSPAFTPRIYSEYAEASTGNAQVAKMKVDGFQPWTTYYYAVENAGSLYTDYIGTLTTFGTGAHSFSFGLGACENNTLGFTQTNTMWATMAAMNPLFALHMGDLHYYNINTNDINRFRVAYNAVLSESTHRTFFSQHGVEYVWDDHDYGPNDSDTTAPGKEAARLCYRETVPHYPLAAGNGNNAIYHTFDVGRCRFIVTDNRSERTPYTIADNPTKTVLGDEQKKWFKEQVLAANADGSIAVTFWVNSFPWTGTGSPGAFPPRENWAAYPTERAEIATFLKSNSVQNLFILSGDMHACAFDDGRTYDFSADGTNPFPGGTFAHGLPVFQAAPFYQSSSSKGTPYMIGPMIVAGVRDQFGMVNVMDYGSNVLINFTGYDGLTGLVLNQAGTYMTYTLNGTASPRP